MDSDSQLQSSVLEELKWSLCVESVASWAEHDQAAWSAPGVTDVKNDLSVAP